MIPILHIPYNCLSFPIRGILKKNRPGLVGGMLRNLNIQQIVEKLKGLNTYAGFSVKKITAYHIPDILKRETIRPWILLASFPRLLISWSAFWGSSAPTRTLKKSPEEVCCRRVECGRRCASTYRKRAAWVRCVFFSSAFPPHAISCIHSAVLVNGACYWQVVVSLSDELLSQAVMMVESCRPTLTINLSGARQHWLEGMLRHEIGMIDTRSTKLVVMALYQVQDYLACFFSASWHHIQSKPDYCYLTPSSDTYRQVDLKMSSTLLSDALCNILDLPWFPALRYTLLTQCE